MKKEIIKLFIGSKLLRTKSIDEEKIKSLISSAEINAKVARKIPITDESATLIFREIYESIRQLGDACWWTLGYETLNHEISLEILKDLDIEEKLKLSSLTRFKQIRHDANYRGFRVSVSQAKEIIEFWDMCSGDIIDAIMNKKIWVAD